MSLALSICVLLISLMQLVNGAQFLNIIFLLVLFALNITFLLVLFASASAAAVLLTATVHLIKIYASL